MKKFFNYFVAVVYLIPFMIAVDGIYYLEFFVLLSLIGMLLFGLNMPVARATVMPANYDANYSLDTKIILIPLVLFFIFKFIALQFDFSVPISDYMRDAAINRYTDPMPPTFVERISTILLFLSWSLWACMDRPFKYKSITILFVATLILESLTLSRAGVLIALVMFFPNFLIANNHLFLRYKAIKYIQYASISTFILVVIFTFSAYFRLNDDAMHADIILSKISSYTIAPYQALYISMSSEEWYWGGYGYNTFTSIYKLFGFTAQQGFYDLVSTGFGPTNIFTIFRGLLFDFSFPGAAFLLCLFGLIINISSYKRISIYKTPFLFIIITLLLFPFYSIYSFFNVLIAFVMSYLVLIIFNLFRVRRIL